MLFSRKTRPIYKRPGILVYMLSESVLLEIKNKNILIIFASYNQKLILLKFRTALSQVSFVVLGPLV